MITCKFLWLLHAYLNITFTPSKGALFGSFFNLEKIFIFLSLSTIFDNIFRLLSVQLNRGMCSILGEGIRVTTICKADYYYGALLSALVNGGLAPALFEKENESRQIYTVTTNKDSYIIYTKYHTTPSGSEDFTWSFTFSDNEIQEIINVRQNYSDKTLIFAFICGQKQVSDNNQIIAIVYWDEFIACVDVNKQQSRGKPRLSVKVIKGSPRFRIYGSKRADLLDGKDNTIKIERNRLREL